MKTFCFKLYHSDHNNALMHIAKSIDGEVNTVPYGVQATAVKRDAVADICIYLVCDTKSALVEARTGKSVGLGRVALRKLRNPPLEENT